MAQLVVLTERTIQIAPRKKDRAGPVSSPKAVFLAVVGEGGRDNGLLPGAAVTNLTVQAFDTALTRTEAAGFKQRPRFFGAFFYLFGGKPRHDSMTVQFE